ncbi:lysis system i-spanin subunit Rz [Xenorhabdus doucetiae]|uniref:lysis system i-spanin subunit Rz n=1 Tax=Xenorhabdus doucetiae TaxID=351671 RepID=UPI002B41484B|nr:lysis system i-spanin subunit Rz [Xenorhabdus sp. 18]
MTCSKTRALRQKSMIVTGLETFGIPINFAPAIGGAIGFIGVEKIREFAIRAINKRLGDKELSDDFSKQTALITNQQSRIQHLAELDKAHIQELANAKTEIDILRADVAAGRRKLRIKARCPVRETAPSGSLGDGASVELTGEAGSTVLDIREDIINDRAKLKYLQGYIKT